LRELVLELTKITDTGMVDLKKVLPKTHILGPAHGPEPVRRSIFFGALAIVLLLLTIVILRKRRKKLSAQ